MTSRYDNAFAVGVGRCLWRIQRRPGTDISDSRAGVRDCHPTWRTARLLSGRRLSIAESHQKSITAATAFTISINLPKKHKKKTHNYLRARLALPRAIFILL
ncbi:uncharacterized protein LOC105428775 [Pogonomyrmex barbatus]|uniref:Uncharacterized protein LOC105428775 n=1 Tax=Pogonomyrmex barbatus TaxID=144034 RepID=A0A6I9WF01_9HYME|nr:uncharacterized protein LOC105428775 [Pogonomyrmex barbatus]